MEGIRETYEKAFRQRADNELEEAKKKFRTKIAAAINEFKRYKLSANRDAEEIWKGK